MRHFLFLLALPVAAATCDSLQALKITDTTMTLVQEVAQGAFTTPRLRASRAITTLQGPAGVLPRGGFDEAIRRFGYQDGAVATGHRLEWQFPGHGQWRLDGLDQRGDAGRWFAARICGGQFRFGPRWWQRGVCAGAPGEGDRLRLSRHA